MSAHIFNPEIAVQVGVNAAVIYQNIVFWCEKNAANGKHFYEGKTWTYNSIRAFSEMFPYLTADQIRRALERLEAAGFIGTGNFSEDPRDRTKWFCDLHNMHLATMPAPSGIDANSYKETDVNTDINKDHRDLGFSEVSLFGEVQQQQKREPEGFEQFWEAYPKGPRKTDKPKAKAVFERITAGKHPTIPKTPPSMIVSAIKRFAASDRDVAFDPMPTTWLNGERWQAFADVPPPVDRTARLRPQFGTVVR